MSSLALIVALALLAVALSHVMQARRPWGGAADVPADPVVTGVAVLLCHRLDREAPGAPHDDWPAARTALLAEHAAAIGHRRYARVHQVSRLNVVYLLLRLSRSWPVNAAFSVLHGLPLPRLALLDPEARREDWDIVEILDFADAAAAHRFLAGAGAATARAALAADAAARTSRSQAVPMTVTRAHLRAPAALGSVVTLFCLRARPEIGRAGMIDYWLDRHRPFVQGEAPLLDYAWYDQLVARGAEDLADPATALDHAAGAPWDGAASIGYGHMRDIIRGVYDVRLQAANMRLVYDETRFLDLTRSSLMLGEVRLVAEPAHAGTAPDPDLARDPAPETTA